MRAAGSPALFSSGVPGRARSAGRCWAALTAGFGLAAPFLIYGVALLVAAAVVFFSLRHSSLAAPAEQTEPTGVGAGGAAQPGLPGGAVLQLRDGLGGVRAADRVGAAVRRRGAGTAAPVSRVWRWRRSRSATSRPSSPAATCPTGSGRRTLLIVGLTVSAVATCAGRASRRRCRCSWPARYVAGAAAGHLHLAAAGRGRRHHRQQGARRDRGGDVPDDGRPRLDRRLAGGRPGRPARVIRLGVRGQRRRSCWSAAVGWVFAPETAAGGPPSTPRPARWARRPAAKCRDLRF